MNEWGEKERELRFQEGRFRTVVFPAGMAVLDFDNPLCRGAPDLFFPEQGVSKDAVGEARLICGQCDHELDCREFGLETNQLYGVWGGLTTRDRQRERKARKENANRD